METGLLSVVAVLIPVPLVYLFYLRYFRTRAELSEHIEFFMYGILLAALIFLFHHILPFSGTIQDPLIRGFLQAALIEKAGAWVLITILVYRVKSGLTMPHVITVAMLAGLGFATLENLVYAATMHWSVIIIRSISSVHLHVLTCGLAGYYIGLSRFNEWKVHKTSLLLKAFLLPFVIHGLFDASLMSGRHYTYLAALILILLIAAIEFLFQKSRSIPSIDELRRKKLSLEDWHTIEQEPQYERWILRSMGSKIRELVPFFQLKLDLPRSFAVILLLSTAAVLYYSKGELFKLFHSGIGREGIIMLFTLIPTLYALNILIVGIVNPAYFKNSILRIPIIIDVVVSLPVDMTKDDVVDTVTYHITGMNSFIKAPEPLPAGESIKCILYCAKFSSPVIEGKIKWDCHDDLEKHKGSLIRFRSRSPGFLLFLLRYNIYRISRGIRFNLKFPGFGEIRELFVRPVSVMQDDSIFSADHVLFKQGERGTKFYLIRKGEVEIIKRLGDGRKVLLNTLSRGDILGEMALIGNQTRTASAVCKTECILAEAEADNLGALIENSPDFTGQLIRLLAGRYHSYDTLMNSRLARFKTSRLRSDRLIYAALKLMLITAGCECQDDKIIVKSGDISGVDTEDVDKLVTLIKNETESSLIEEELGSKTCDRIIRSMKKYRIHSAITKESGHRS